MRLQTSRDILASRENAFAWIKSAETWPVLFQPNIFTERVSVVQSRVLREELSMCALVGDGVRQWRSMRTIDNDRYLVEFHQEHGRFPIEKMRGEWRVIANGNSCRVTLCHNVQFSSGATDGDRYWVAEQINRNSERELKALAQACEVEGRVMENYFEVDDIIDVLDAQSTFEWIWNAHLWPRRVKHINSAAIDDMGNGAQRLLLNMIDNVQTESIRVRTGDRIWYKQLHVPAGLSGHAGFWEIVDSKSLRTHHAGLLDRRGEDDSDESSLIQEWCRTFVSKSRSTVASQDR